MAKVNIIYDTVEKTCKMDMNGVSMDDLMGISLYRDGKKWRMSASKQKMDEDNDISHYESMYCNQNEPAKTLDEQVSKFINDFRR